MAWHTKQLRTVRRDLTALVAVLILSPVAIVWDSLPAAASQADSSASLVPVVLAGSSTPTLRAKVTGVPSSTVTPTGTVTFTIEDSGPIQCDDLPSDTVRMSGGVATCKVTSGLPASGSPETAQATYSGDDNFMLSDGTYTSNDGSFSPGASRPSPAITAVGNTCGAVGSCSANGNPVGNTFGGVPETVAELAVSSDGVALSSAN